MPKKHQEQLHQQRGALEQFDIGARNIARECLAADAQGHHQQADQAATDKRHDRQQQRPLQARKQVAHDVPEGKITHRLFLITKRRPIQLSNWRIINAMHRYTRVVRA